MEETREVWAAALREAALAITLLQRTVDPGAVNTLLTATAKILLCWQEAKVEVEAEALTRCPWPPCMDDQPALDAAALQRLGE